MTSRENFESIKSIIRFLLEKETVENKPLHNIVYSQICLIDVINEAIKSTKDIKSRTLDSTILDDIVDVVKKPIAELLIGSVNAPEQELYKLAREIATPFCFTISVLMKDYISLEQAFRFYDETIQGIKDEVAMEATEKKLAELSKMAKTSLNYDIIGDDNVT